MINEAVVRKDIERILRTPKGSPLPNLALRPLNADQPQQAPDELLNRLRAELDRVALNYINPAVAIGPCRYDEKANVMTVTLNIPTEDIEINFTVDTRKRRSILDPWEVSKWEDEHD